MIRSSKLSSSTVRYTHLPSLRLFRELVSEHRRFDDPTGTPGVWDLRVAELTPARIDAFLEMFWRFPSRQGKRPNLADAKQVLAEGGEPQSHDNTIKRIVHIKRLLSWLCDRGDLSKSVLGPLRAELEGTPRSSRESAPVDDLDLGEADDEDGYVAFTVEDIDKIFDRDVYSAHAARNAARYFIPLLGRFTAARLNEIAQATVKDVRQIRGIHCLCVTAKERDAHGAVRSVQQSKKRVKSKAGRRTIPLHPELIRLGFLEYVAQRMASEERFLFDLKWLEKDGFGKYPGRDFRRLTEFVGVWERRRKVFHSFRSTLAQELERHGLQETLIQRVLGHAVRTTRIKHYSRNSDGSTVPLQIVLDALCKVPGLPVFPTWNEVRTASRLQLRLVANDSRFCIREDQTGSGQGQAKPAEADGLDSWNTALRHGKSCR